MNLKKIRMRLSKIIIIAGLTSMVLSSVSCKKKGDSKDNSQYFSGSIKFELPLYVSPGEKFSITPKGIKRKDGGNFGYYWKISPSKQKADTTKFEDKEGDGMYTFVIPDTLTQITVSCTAFAKGYYSSTASARPIVVGCKNFPSESIEGPGPAADDIFVVDTRDNKKYYAAKFGDTYWLRNNLSYSQAGVPFMNCHQADVAFGLFYNYEEALTMCPEGWRLPTDKDWVELAKSFKPGTDFKEHDVLPGVAGNLMSLTYFNKIRFWEFVREVRTVDNSPFCALPMGYATIGETASVFEGSNSYAAFWTADTKDANTAYARILYLKSPDILISTHDRKSFGASVRCVKK